MNFADTEQWRPLAACRNEPTELFFPVEHEGAGADARAAKTICRGCPVRTECLEFALATHQAHGVWGGMGQRERDRLRRSRQRYARMAARQSA